MTGRIFGRESQMYLEGACGKLSFGRVAVLMSDLGSFGLMGEVAGGIFSADRLGGMSLAQAAVLGREAGRSAAFSLLA